MLKLFFFLIFCPVVVMAQFPFTIKGTGKAYKDGDVIYLLYRQGTARLADSAVVRNGAFEFKGIIKGVARGWVSRNYNPAVAEYVYDVHDLFLEKGTIMLHSPDSLKNAVTSGTPLNRDFQQLSDALEPVAKKYSVWKNLDDFSPAELKDTALVRLAKERARARLVEENSIKLDFVKKHPASYVSLYYLAYLARFSYLMPQVEERFDGLSAALKSMPEGSEIRQAIELSKVVKVGTMARDFTQPDTNGKPVRLSDFKGKYVLLDFWASWCLPCREENANVRVAYDRYKARGFTVLSVSIDQLKDKAEWLKAIEKDKLTWTQVADLKGTKNEAYLLYGIRMIPANVLIDPDGKIIAKDIKGIELQQALEKLPGLPDKKL